MPGIVRAEGQIATQAAAYGYTNGSAVVGWERVGYVDVGGVWWPIVPPVPWRGWGIPAVLEA